MTPVTLLPRKRNETQPSWRRANRRNGDAETLERWSYRFRHLSTGAFAGCADPSSSFSSSSERLDSITRTRWTTRALSFPP